MKLFSIQSLLNLILHDHICARMDSTGSPRALSLVHDGCFSIRHSKLWRISKFPLAMVIENGLSKKVAGRKLGKIFFSVRILRTNAFNDELVGHSRAGFYMTLLEYMTSICSYLKVTNFLRARPERVEGYERKYLHLKPGFTIIESVLTLVIIAFSLTTLFSLQTKLIKSVFGSHDIIEHLIGVKNFIVQDDQEEYYKKNKTVDKKGEDNNYSINYVPKSNKQFPALSHHKNIVVEKITLSSKSVFINHDEFIFFRFNPEGKK